MNLPLPQCCSGFLYAVMSGDTIYNIAKRFGVDTKLLIKANPQISRPNSICPGQIICIPRESEAVKNLHLSTSLSPQIAIPGQPEVSVTKCDSRIIPMLFDLFAGAKSELTQTLQMHNHHMHYIVCEPKDIGIYLDGMGNTDMQHLHVLGQLILKMGCEIPYEHPNDNGWKYWGGEYVYVGTDLKDRLEADINLKKAGVDAYNCILAMKPEKSVYNVLCHIRDEELLHIEVLKKLMKKFVINPCENSKEESADNEE